MIIVVAFSTLLSSFAFYAYQMVYVANLNVDKTESYLYIPTGADFADVQKLVKEQEVVNNLIAFSFLAKLMDYHESIKPGRYLIKQDMNNLDAIRMLRAGEQVPTQISFRAAKFVSDLAAPLSENIELTEAEVASFLADSLRMVQYGFTPETYMGMFIPNTYEVYWTIDGEGLMDRLKKEYDAFWTTERIAKADSMNMTRNEVITLAAIVQAETAQSDEKPTVAGVYINRLNKGIKLAADPTLIYAAKDFTIRRVLNKHKKIDSPYNTYMYKGLPPGPIRMPNITSLDAVLNYEEHDYIFFCAKEDFSGYHNFAVTYADHKKNARKYQKALNARKIFK